MKTNEKYKLGVALSGGGVRGFAHLGALQAMNERGIFPDLIAGTSVGSLVGALYADGYSPQEIYKMAEALKMREFITTAIPYDGFLRSTGIQSFLKKHLRAKRFEELKTPLRVVASDIEQGTSFVFTTGEIIPAVAASCSVPIVFSPVEISGHYYVDGGLFANFPVSVIRKDCRRVMGVDISPVISMKYDRSFKYIIERTMNYMVGANTVKDRKNCDYLIESAEVSAYSLFDMKSGESIYEKGYTSAVEYLETHKKKIQRELLNPPPQTLWHRISRIVKPEK
ncbi:patatin-like phospholipase family protein [Parabacteroides sp. PF5-9]|uniref:patatin-like phospholipase family protein n=1 Tax=Parabacteroides sp. PF5-9 TaxID=1742404 RepID=UPI00247433FD|nr:patatin-like phospholipase family protein [Parabacteroides sp. PF5-9]